MRFSNVLLVLGVGAVAVPAMNVGCSGEGASGTAGTAGTSGTGPAGSTGSGNDFPCSPKAAECKTVTSDCIALADNSTADPFGYRMGQLTITKPDVLGKGLVGNLVADGLTMNLPACNLQGGGTFSWLLQFNSGTGKLLTGGAKPAQDPLAGYCFVNETLGGFDIAAKEVDAKPDADGKFTAMTGDIIVPIFLDAMAMSSVLMPLHEVVLTGQISEDRNCIGKYNADTLDPANDCAPETGKTAFTNAGSLEGYITLEEADMVIVDSLAQSLCVLLSGDPAMFGDGASPAKCKRDAGMKIVYQGDWCKATNKAADAACADASKLGAEYAASGVRINGDCK